MVFSIEKIKRDLGWEPQMSIAQGLADSYRWFAHEGGRENFTYDFSMDDEVLAEIGRRGGARQAGGPSRTVVRAQLDTLKDM